MYTPEAIWSSVQTCIILHVDSLVTKGFTRESLWIKLYQHVSTTHFYQHTNSQVSYFILSY